MEMPLLRPSESVLAAVVILLCYVVVVFRLRFRRLRQMHRKFDYPDRESFSRMTLTDAYAIQRYLAELEFPKVFSTSVFFALFKTYGIPSISKLLMATGQLGDELTASKRAADTGVILTEIVLNNPASERNRQAIARMNYLHNSYRKAGKISDEDMLYTLSLFTLEPSRWVNRYEWRRLTDMELCAIGTYWKELGDAMEIPFNNLSSYEDGWTDGLHWLEDLSEWSSRYEENHMLPADSNYVMANGTIGILMAIVPGRLHGIARSVVSALLEPRLRVAMKLREPHPVYFHALEMGTSFRKLLLRYFALPRPEFMRVLFINEKPDVLTGTYHSIRWVAHPWYIKPSISSRWGYQALISRLLGAKLPGDDGPKYCPGGYKIPDLGPTIQLGKGQKYMESTEARLLEMSRGGCPFH